jgi:hypothetical protein
VVTKKLSIRPEYSLMEIRDLTPPADQAAADAAANQAGTSIAAATREAVYLYAAQSLLPVELTVKAYSRPRNVDESSWDGTFRFDVDFPSGAARFGHTFHRADTIDLPAGAGTYTVTVQHAGRTDVFQKVAELNRQLVGWTSEEQERELDRNAGIERYLVTIAPQH